MSYKLIFFGSPKNAADLLAKLNTDPRFQVVAVITQPDRPLGRKQMLTATPVAQYAEANTIITLKPARHPQKKHLLKEPKKLQQQIQDLLTSYRPSCKKTALDLIVAYEFGQLIPETILALARLAALNIHFSLLPSYRGAAPLPWQIVNDEKETGISVVKMSAKFDQGRLIYQEKQPIKPADTSQTLHRRLSLRVLQLFPDLLFNYAAGKLPDYPPSPHLPDSYCPRLTRQTGFIPWDNFRLAVQGKAPEKAREIARKLRAFSPWPGVWTIMPQTTRRTRPGPTSARLQGKRLKILSAKLAGGKLIPLKVRLAGKTASSWAGLSLSL